ncbi:hypothetical protein VTN49DRAFT_5834 [Thermomyces lanuginosus]|uniref:uncharacterized protein n=1 Tax=Thermomyces lanuginosus TaxID=5541 RepID=UPI0037435952
MSVSELHRRIIRRHYYRNEAEYRRLRRERVQQLIRSGAEPEEIYRLVRVRIRGREGANTAGERAPAGLRHGIDLPPREGTQERKVNPKKQERTNEKGGDDDEDTEDGGVRLAPEPQQEKETRTDREERRVAKMRKEIVLHIVTERLEAGEYPFISLDEYRQLCTPEACRKLMEMERPRHRARIDAIRPRRLQRKEQRKRAREE